MVNERVAASGQWGIVEWAIDAAGQLPAKAFFDGLDVGGRAKVAALFQKLAEQGRINNREKFRSLGAKAGVGRGLWEFKSFQVRMIGDFRPGSRFVVAHGLIKKQDDLPKPDIGRAVRILSENDAREGAKPERR